MKYHSLLKNLFYATLSIMALNFSGVTMAKNTMNDIYVINLSSNNAVCGVKINEMLVMHNKKYPKGHYSAGQNISSVLENGKKQLLLLRTIFLKFVLFIPNYDKHLSIKI
ncbi:TPA: hypothetical protein ACKRFN_003112 [Proteus mirabilis]